MKTDAGTEIIQVLLLGINIYQFDFIPRNNFYRSPDSAGNETRSKVPAVLTLRFARENFFFSRQSVWQLLRKLFSPFYCGLKTDEECVIFFLQNFFYIHTPPSEHVVSRKYKCTVEKNFCIRIEPVKFK